jgi:preprotein translocase subunit SecG
VLGKITTVAATVFLITSFSLAVLSHKRAETIMPASAPAAAPAPAGTAPGKPAPAPIPPAPLPEKK